MRIGPSDRRARARERNTRGGKRSSAPEVRPKSAVGAARSYHRELRMTSTPTPPARGLLQRLGAALGWISLFAATALLSPGVFAARADELSASPGPACEAGGSAEQVAVDLSRMIERLRARAEAEGGNTADVVVLNNRGYNYAPSPEPLESLVGGEERR
jgi:hypothetical protein